MEATKDYISLDTAILFLNGGLLHGIAILVKITFKIMKEFLFILSVVIIGVYVLVQGQNRCNNVLGTMLYAGKIYICNK